MSNLTDQLCLDAHNVASSYILKLLVISKMIIGCFGAFSVVFLYRKKGCAWIPNPNAKLLYKAHIYLAFHSSFTFSFIYLFDLIRMSIISTNSCFYVLDARISCLIRMIPVLAIVTQSFNMFSFAMERAVSTIFLSKYEKVSTAVFGHFLLMMAVCLAFSLDMYSVLLPIPPNVFVSTITTRNPQNSAVYQMSVVVPFMMEVITITIFGLTYCLNLWKMRQYGQDSTKLGDRYQIAENKKVISALFPCFMVHFILSTMTYGGISLYPMIFGKYDSLTSAIWVECVAHAQNYSLLMSLLLMCRMRTKYRISAYDAEAATKAHFKKLNEIFNGNKQFKMIK